MARKPKEPTTPDILIQRLKDTADAFGWIVTSHQIDSDGAVILTLHTPPPSTDEEAKA